MRLKAAHKTPLKMAFYLLFILYIVSDLYLCSGPLRRSMEGRLDKEGLSTQALRERQAAAKIYGEVITRDELRTRTREDLFLNGKKESDLTPEELKQQRFITLSRMIDDSLIRLKTKVNDLRRPFDHDRVEREWRQFAARFSSEEELDKALAAQKLDRRAMRLIIEARLQQEAQINESIDKAAEPSGQDLKDAWASLQKEYRPAPARSVSQIFLPTLHKDREQVKKEAESLMEKLKQGAPFAALAAEFSQDEASAAKGGDMGRVTGNRKLPGDLQKTLFDLPENKPSLVETPLGFHLFLCGPVETPPLPDFETLRPALRSALLSIRRVTARDLLLEQLKREAKFKKRIEIFMENV